MQDKHDYYTGLPAQSDAEGGWQPQKEALKIFV